MIEKEISLRAFAEDLIFDRSESVSTADAE
jgi:hypothetical protein